MKQRKRGKQFLSVLLAAALVAQPGSMLSGNNHKAKAAPGLSNPVVKDGVVTWDTVYFGKYWQRDTNGDGKADKNDAKESIRWRVLSVNGNEAFLLADQNLDCKPYNEEYEGVTWETCTLRAWLNQEFLQAAFTAEEQKAIPLSNVRNVNNPYYDTEGGKDTADRVYLLSIGEASNIAYGFDTEFRTVSETRVSKNTPYAQEQGDAYTYTVKDKEGCWWLRSPGNDSHDASIVSGDGWGDVFGAISGHVVVRPALKLSLSSPLWTKGDPIRASLAGNETPSTGGTGEKNGLQSKKSLQITVKETVNIGAQIFAESKAKLESYCAEARWSSSDSSVVNIDSTGYVKNKGAQTSGGLSLWWADALVYIQGMKPGTATITGRLPDGTETQCKVTVTAEETENPTGNEKSLTIGANKSGDAGSDVKKFFPSEWSLSSSRYPVVCSQTNNLDGTYTLKISIGIGREDLLDNTTEWNKYKKACEDANKSSSKYDELFTYREMFGLKTSTAVHCSGWKGRKPSLAVMGYLEYKYDKYGNAISRSGMIAGDLEFSRYISWTFATPIGPMYLNLNLAGTVSLEGGPMWDYKKSEIGFDGKISLKPEVTLEGGYGMDKVATIGAQGKAALNIQAVPATKGEIVASAGVRVYIIFILDYTQTLAKGKKTLWDTTKSKNGAAGELPENQPDFSNLKLMSVEKYGSSIDWRGNVKTRNAGALQCRTLQKGVLDSTIPMLGDIDGKKVMVWQGYQADRATANSVALMYSVLKNGSWSEPKAVYDDGFGDSYADLQVIGGKLCLTWQKANKDMSETAEEELLNDMAANTEIYYAEFDSSTDAFGSVKRITDNTACDMMPRFVKNDDRVQIAYVRNSENSMLQETGENAIYVYDAENGKEEELTVSPGSIDRFVAYKEGSEVKAVYVTQTDNVNAVMQSDYTSVEALSSLMRTADSGSITDLVYDSGRLQMISDGTLYSYDPQTEEMTEHTAGNGSFESYAVYCTNGDKSGYIWSTYDEEEDKGSILASMKTEEGYSDPVVLYESQGEISRAMAPVLGADGTWQVALNKEVTAGSDHNLCYLTKEETKESKLYTAVINPDEKKGNLTGIDYTFQNKSDVPIETLKLTVKTEDGSTVETEISRKINPGEMVADTAYVDLSEIPAGQKASVSLMDAADYVDLSKPEDHVVETQYSTTDFALTGTAVQSGSNVKITIPAVNQGEEDGVADFILYKNADMTEEVSRQNGIAIPKGGQKSIEFSMPVSEVVYNENNAAYLTVKANVAGGDSDESNNIVYLALYKGEKINANTKVKEKNDGNTGTDKGDTNQKPHVTPPKQTEPQNMAITKAKIQSAKNIKGRKISLKFKKLSGAKGYQIKYATNKKFKKAKTKNSIKLTYTLKKLKKNKTYYIKARAYALNGKKKVYSKWSAVKKVKVKK